MDRQYKMLEDIIDSLEGNVDNLQRQCDDQDVVIRELEIDLKIEKAKGEKYKAMWEKLEKTMDGFDNKIGLLFNGEDCLKLVKKIRQKYFPQPVKRVIQIEVEGTTNQIDWVKGYITNFIGEKIDNHDNFNQFSEGDIKVNIKESQ